MSSEPSRGIVRGWVLYDDSCGFCRWWVPFWRMTLRKRGFAIAPLQLEWVARVFRIPRDELVNDLRLLLADGTRLEAADVYRYVMKRIWWAFPLYIIAVLPGTRSLFNWGYRTFALNRFRVSRACRLDRPCARAMRRV
jgi:predicted DCC family thiol-disulfide oxidoreductase YuxK